MTDEVYLHIEADAEAAAAESLGEHVAALMGASAGKRVWGFCKGHRQKQ